MFYNCPQPDAEFQHDLLQTMVDHFKNRIEFSTGQCGEWAMALMAICDFVGIHTELCTMFSGYGHENSIHGFLYTQFGIVDHLGLGDSEIITGDYECDMNVDIDTFIEDCQNYVCFCADCIEEIMREMMDVLDLSIPIRIVEEWMEIFYHRPLARIGY